MKTGDCSVKASWVCMTSVSPISAVSEYYIFKAIFQLIKEDFKILLQLYSVLLAKKKSGFN